LFKKLEIISPKNHRAHQVLRLALSDAGVDKLIELFLYHETPNENNDKRL